MEFIPLEIDGLFRVRSMRRNDERGYFMRTYDRDAFLARGLADCSRQISLARNPQRGTLRGLHYQKAPYGETKLVRCLVGAIFDVVADLRPRSPTHLRWLAAELSEENGDALYIPQGLAHGYLTLTAETLVQYQMVDPYVPEAAHGVRYDDPALAIAWPEAPRLITERDLSWPPLSEGGT